MKKLILAVLVFASSLTNAVAGGSEVGGGGKSVVCFKEGSNEIKSVELLDLWEARTLNQMPAKKMKGTVESIVEAHLKNLAWSYPYELSGNLGNGECKAEKCVHDSLRQFANYFLKPNAKVKVMHGVKLVLTNDSFEHVQPAGCEIRQVVNYLPAGGILVDGDLYEKMDKLNKASLIAHEAYYAMLRVFAQETNSVRVRRAIGLSFAGHKFSKAERAPVHGLVCSGSDATAQFSRVIINRAQETDANAQGINLHLGEIFGSKPIAMAGTGVNYPIFTSDVVDVVMTGQCGSYQGNYISVMNFLSGPVEYDHKVRFSTKCESGKLRYFLDDLVPGTKDARQVELRCKIK